MQSVILMPVHLSMLKSCLFAVEEYIWKTKLKTQTQTRLILYPPGDYPNSRPGMPGRLFDLLDFGRYFKKSYQEWEWPLCT